MRFPSIQSVADELFAKVKDLRGWGIDETDVRLQVYPDGDWMIHSGDSSYDQDHRGYWGASGIERTTTKTECRSIASELIEQCRDHRAESV